MLYIGDGGTIKLLSDWWWLVIGLALLMRICTF